MGRFADIVKAELLESSKVKFRVQEECADVIDAIIEKLIRTYKDGGKVLICGNGGSAADAQHIAGELVGRFKFERAGLPAIALTANDCIITAIANDYGYDRVFSRQVEALALPGDTLIGLSTSGNSSNIVQAFYVARKKGVFTICFTGGTGGEIAKIADLALIIPSTDTPYIQEAHLAIGHIICSVVERELQAGWGSNDG
ncbi:MAG: D-sedoheptulose 7-phosphate isomerase [Firmicutes bacterium]|nr:D-sedoheptulose 7-phosphate isomerase [Bacillota bacterium]